MPTPTNLYEYYTGKGQKLPSVQERSSIYERAGLGSALSYTGTAPQNTALLGYLQKQPTPTDKFALQPTLSTISLTSPKVGGSAAQASASFQPPLQPPEQPKPGQESDVFLSASTAPPQITESPASSLISPETGLLKSKPSPFKVGAEKATEDGNIEIPSAADGRDLVNTYVSADNTGLNQQATNFLQQDEFITGLLKSYQDYINPVSQRKSLTETYSQMIKDSGIQALDMELINTKAILEGTEDDIRREITASGSGFATESQILSLAYSRNKNLIKNYNTLLETRNAKEKYLTAMIGLESEDRKAADLKFEQALNFGTKIFEMTQQMKKNAQEAYDRITKAVGYDGLLQMTKNDPSAISAIERTLGFSSGGLRIAANQAQIARTRTERKEELDIETKESQLLTDVAQRANVYSQIQERAQKIGKEAETKEKTTKSQVGKADIVLGKVKEANKLLSGTTGGFFATGLAQTLTGFLGGTPAKNLAAKLNTISANLSFDTLQAMRDASPTGGALGQVSEREIELLGATVASLDPSQSPTQLRSALNDIETHYKNWLSTVGYSVAPNGDIIQIKVK